MNYRSGSVVNDQPQTLAVSVSGSGAIMYWFIPEAWDTKETPPTLQNTPVDVILTTIVGYNRDHSPVIENITYIAGNLVFSRQGDAPGEPVWSIDYREVLKLLKSYVKGLPDA